MAKNYKKITVSFVVAEENAAEMRATTLDMLDISNGYCSIFGEEVTVTVADTPDGAMEE